MNNNATASELMEFGELLMGLAKAVELGWDVVMFIPAGKQGRFICQIENFKPDKQFRVEADTVRGAILEALLEFQSEVEKGA